MKTIKVLTLLDFQRDWDRLVVSGGSKEPEEIQRLVSHHYQHIRNECFGWLSSRLKPQVGDLVFEINWMGQLKRNTAYKVEEISENGTHIKVCGFWDEISAFVVI